MSDGAAALRELARYCESEAERWYEWLGEQGPAVLALPVGEAQIATVGVLLMHVAWVDRVYADLLVGAPAAAYEWLPTDSVEPIRATHREAFAKLRSFLDGADDAALARELTLRVRGLRLSAPAGKMAAHMLVHGIRHYAQLATKLREQGRTSPWQHDLITGEGFGPPGVFSREEEGPRSG